MIRLLMFDFDPRLISTVARTLRQNAVEVIGVQSLEHAYERTTTHPFDGALLDGDVLRPSELGAFWPLPLILTTSFLEPSGGRRWLSERRMLHKPFTSGQLLSALSETFGPLALGSASLVDVLRRAHTEGRSVALRVGRGEVFIEAGELVHAELDGVIGEAALVDVLTEIDPIVVRIGDRAVERTIHKPFRPLLLDLLCFIEEREKRALPPAQRSSTRLRLVRGGSSS